MKKRKISELDNETLERVVTMAQEEKKPFEVLKKNLEFQKLKLQN